MWHRTMMKGESKTIGNFIIVPDASAGTHIFAQLKKNTQTLESSDDVNEYLFLLFVQRQCSSPSQNCWAQQHRKLSILLCSSTFTQAEAAPVRSSLIHLLTPNALALQFFLEKEKLQSFHFTPSNRIKFFSSGKLFLCVPWRENIWKLCNSDGTNSSSSVHYSWLEIMSEKKGETFLLELILKTSTWKISSVVFT